MKVLPAINCYDFKCVLVKLAQLHDTPAHFIHIDVSDGKFTKIKSWNEPKELGIITSEWPELNFEIHLMIENPEKKVAEWFKAGAKRVLIHLEAIKSEETIYKLIKMGEIGLSIKPETKPEKLLKFSDKISFFQLLAVKPGPSGQKFDEKTLEKIKFLKKNAPKAKIEIDGGMNLENAKLVKRAGADFIVSASYIFDHHHPKKAFQELSKT
ncbi:MAG: hypothetical protein AAB617_02950 [Patescibacteria group bacterium]